MSRRRTSRGRCTPCRWSFPGIQTPWVYPIGALPLILAPLAAGEQGYLVGWLVLVLLFDAAAFAAMIRRRTRRRVAAAWWWIGFLILLGPIAMGRIDSITVPLAIVGVLFVVARPPGGGDPAGRRHLDQGVAGGSAGRVGGGLPATLAHPRGGGGDQRGDQAIALLLGGGANLFSFVGEQAARGLQVEAPISTSGCGRRSPGSAGTFVYYDRALLTWQVAGLGVDVASAMMTRSWRCAHS